MGPGKSGAEVKEPTTCITNNNWNQLLSPKGEGDPPPVLSCWNFTTMHVMLSPLPRENAVSVSFRAAASGSSSIFTSATASCMYEKDETVDHTHTLERCNSGILCTISKRPNEDKCQKKNFCNRNANFNYLLLPPSQFIGRFGLEMPICLCHT